MSFKEIQVDRYTVMEVSNCCVALFRLLVHEDEGTRILRNASNYLPVDMV